MINILIVEDEISIAKLMKMSLKRAGYECDCVYDGEEAADRIGTGKYDLILLDVMLPKISGFELMEYIRPMGIPVIFITAKNAVADRVKGLRMGAEDYIVKPFEIIELLESLHSKASGAFDPIRGGRPPPRAPPPQLDQIHLYRGFLTI